MSTGQEFNALVASDLNDEAKSPMGNGENEATAVDVKAVEGKDTGKQLEDESAKKKLESGEKEHVTSTKKELEGEAAAEMKEKDASTELKVNAPGDARDGGSRGAVDAPRRPLAETPRPRMTVDQASNQRKRNLLRDLGNLSGDVVVTTPTQRPVLQQQERPAPRLPTPVDKRGPKVPLVLQDVVLQRDQAAEMLSRAMALEKAEKAARALREAAAKHEDECRRERMAVEDAVAQLVSPDRNESGARNIVVLQSALRRAQTRVSTIAGSEFARARVLAGDRSAPERHSRQSLDRRAVFDAATYREMRMAEMSMEPGAELPQLLDNFKTYTKVLHTMQARKDNQQLLPKRPKMVVVSPNTSIIMEDDEPSSPTTIMMDSDNDDDSVVVEAGLEAKDEEDDEGEETATNQEDLLMRLVSSFDEPSLIEQLVMEGADFTIEAGHHNEHPEHGAEEMRFMLVGEAVPLAATTRPAGPRFPQPDPEKIIVNEKHWELVPFKPRQHFNLQPVVRSSKRVTEHDCLAAKLCRVETEEDVNGVKVITLLMDLLLPMPIAGTTVPAVPHLLRPVATEQSWAVVAYVARNSIDLEVNRLVVRCRKRSARDDVGPYPKRSRADQKEEAEDAKQLTVVVLNMLLPAVEVVRPVVTRLLLRADFEHQWAVVPFVPRMAENEAGRGRKRTSEEDQGPHAKRRRISQVEPIVEPARVVVVNNDEGRNGEEDEHIHGNDSDVENVEDVEAEAEAEDLATAILATPPALPIQHPSPPPSAPGSPVHAGRQPAGRGWGRLPGERLRRRSGVVAAAPQRVLGPLPATVMGRIEHERRRIDNFLLAIIEMLEAGREDQLNQVLDQQRAAGRALTTLKRLSNGPATTMAEVDKAISRLEKSNAGFVVKF